MKKISIIFFSVFALVSCGSKDSSIDQLIEQENLSDLRAKKAELSDRQADLSAQIAKLDAAIEKLDQKDQLPLIKTMAVKDTLFQHFIEIPGDVETDENIIIYPEYSGILVDVLVDEGEQVEKGQVLARIDDGGLASQLAELETRKALAETTFERQKRLWEQNIGSEIQFLEAKTNYEAIQNSVDQLKSRLAKAVVRAPFSGIIDEVFSEQGEVVAPGQNQLFRLIDLSDMFITADVPENYLGKIKKGTKVIVEIGATGTRYESQVRHIGNFINPNNRTFEVRVKVPDSIKQIKPNLIATLKLNDYTAENAVTIPEGVIQKNAAGQSVAFVFLPKNDSTGLAEKRILNTGLTYGNKVEVLSGLQTGELLVSEGARNINEGEEVKTIQ